MITWVPGQLQIVHFVLEAEDAVPRESSFNRGLVRAPNRNFVVPTLQSVLLALSVVGDYLAVAKWIFEQQRSAENCFSKFAHVSMIARYCESRWGVLVAGNNVSQLSALFDDVSIERRSQDVLLVALV